jgi:hypothetical protein
VATGKYCAVALLRIVEMVALHEQNSVTDVVDILDVNYDDLFCDYNTLTTVNSVTNTRTIQQTPMFHGCTITNLNRKILFNISKSTQFHMQ